MTRVQTPRPPRRLIHLERLLGRKVHDPAGQLAGRIEEFRTRKKGDALFIEEYILGSAGLMERLSIAGLSGWLIHLLGARSAHHNHIVKWNELDLGDIAHPRLKIPRDQLKPIEEPASASSKSKS
jgi:hypothetical protein